MGVKRIAVCEWCGGEADCPEDCSIPLKQGWDHHKVPGPEDPEVKGRLLCYGCGEAAEKAEQVRRSAIELITRWLDDQLSDQAWSHAIATRLHEVERAREGPRCVSIGPSATASAAAIARDQEPPR